MTTSSDTTAAVSAATPEDAAPDQVIVRNPRTGAVLGEYPVMDEAQVTAAVRRGREAARWWAGRSFRERRELLLRVKSEMARNLDRIAGVIADETGKPLSDAKLETILTVEYLDWAAKNAERTLSRRSVRPGFSAIHQQATVHYEPLGVVGVIGPWNYPLWTPMGSISFALAAGNAVVYKPSELTIGVAKTIAEIVDRVCPQPILQVITGFGETGATLIRSGVDKIAFTGSAATARRVMAEAAESLTPVTIEAGGNDAMMVGADADLDQAATAAVFGALGNAGQTCAGVERIYVVKSVRDEFVRRVVAQVEKLKVGDFPASAYGPMTLARQTGIVREQVRDALERGANAVVGGVDSVGERFIEPIVLTDVPADSSAMLEETFGPTIVINAVADLDEAVELANTGTYGLAASVFTRDRRRAEDIASRLRVGAVTINSVLGFAAIPALPFGGVGDSGFGRIHGEEGFREFSRPKSVTRQRFKPFLDVMSMSRTDKDMGLVERFFKFQHGR